MKHFLQDVSRTEVKRLVVVREESDDMGVEDTVKTLDGHVQA